LTETIQRYGPTSRPTENQPAFANFRHTIQDNEGPDPVLTDLAEPPGLSTRDYGFARLAMEVPVMSESFVRIESNRGSFDLPARKSRAGHSAEHRLPRTWSVGPDEVVIESVALYEGSLVCKFPMQLTMHGSEFGLWTVQLTEDRKWCLEYIAKQEFGRAVNFPTVFAWDHERGCMVGN